MNALQIIGYIVATLIPLLALYLIHAIDRYKTGNFRFVLLCFAFGGLAVWGAGEINQYLYNNRILGYSEIVRFAAPVIEELLKALILFYLITRTDFRLFVDGAVYGFAVGIGFAIAENYFYLWNTPGMELSTAVGRVISANLIHAAASALVGISLGLGRFEPAGRRVATGLTGMLLAIVLHSIFNNVVDRAAGGLVLTIAAAVLGMGGAVGIALIMRRGLAEEKRWIEEKLGAADRVEKGEAAAVQKLETIDDLLAPLRERFGEEKTDTIEKFLVIQARLGILRKLLDKPMDERMRKATEKQMGDLRAEMEIARRQVGAYAMLYLRHAIPRETSPLWNRLENVIQDRISARQSSDGPGVWAAIGQKSGTAAPAAAPAKAEDSPPKSALHNMFSATPARPASASQPDPANRPTPPNPFGKPAKINPPPADSEKTPAPAETTEPTSFTQE